MLKRALPLIVLGLTMLAVALLMPSATGVRIPAPRLSPTPEAVNTPLPTFTPAPTPTPMPIPEEYVLRSMTDSRVSHEDVKAIQARLSELGFYAGSADGFYGQSTFEAVYNFQRMNSLTMDGKAGVETQRVLFESDEVRNSLGRVHKPLSVPTPMPSPTPAPTKPSLPLDEFSAGAKPNPSWYGGSVYRDKTIEAAIKNDSGIVTVTVSLTSPSQLRSALAGTFELPQSLPLERLSALNSAVVAFAGPDYRVSDDVEVRQRLFMKTEISSEKPLLIIDTQGKFRIYKPANAQEALDRLGPRVYQALTVSDALIISGITQTGLSEDKSGRLLAIGQAGELRYVLISAEISPSQLAALMKQAGCDDAAVIGSGGIYTCFGDQTAHTHEDQANASNIIYFACLSGEAD